MAQLLIIQKKTMKQTNKFFKTITMKKIILLTGFLFVTVLSFGQKKELRTASKAIKAENFTEAKSVLSSIEGSIDSADKKLQASYYLYKSQAYFMAGKASSKNDLITAAKAIKKAKELNADVEIVASLTDEIRTTLINSAVADQNASKFENAARKLEGMYRVNTQDTIFLYFAAVNMVSGKNYGDAVIYYNELIDLGFTGIVEKIVATDAETGEEKEFGSVNERLIYLKSKAYINPKIIKTKSKVGEITKNIALIYVDQGKTDLALEAIANARALFPDDMSLLLSEADIEYKLGNTERFKELMKEATNKEPNNPELLYNLGVVSANAGNIEDAKGYYNEALAIKPNYTAANINLSSLILEGESAIVEEMNGLGTSRADNLRYDELKEMRTELYTKAIPYLEAALKEETNIEVVRTLMNIYSIVGETDKFKMMKAKLTELEEGN